MNYLTINELAKTWRISTKTITAWVRSGKVPATKFGHQYRILQDDATRLENEWKTVKGAV